MNDRTMIDAGEADYYYRQEFEDYTMEALIKPARGGRWNISSVCPMASDDTVQINPDASIASAPRAAACTPKEPIKCPK